MDIDLLLDLLNLINQKEQEDKAYRQWCSMLPFMSLNMLEYISFNEYADKLNGKNIDLRPRGEIIKELEEIHNKGGAAK